MVFRLVFKRLFNKKSPIKPADMNHHHIMGGILK